MKKFVSVFAMVLLAFLLPVGVRAAQVSLVEGGGATKLAASPASYVPYEGASYELTYEENSDGTLTITGYTGTAEGELILPESIDGKKVTEIGWYAFGGCSGFTDSLLIPDSVTSIGDHAFIGCSGFTGSLSIPDGVTEIGFAVFRGCSGFTGGLVIPDSVTSIGESAFESCSGFTGSLVIPDSVTKIGGYAFNDCSGFTGSLTIPDSVTSIGDHAFIGCSGFTGSLTIPDSVIEIGWYAFEGCSGFTGDLTIGTSVTKIGPGTFRYCRGFTGDLIIPDSVTEIVGDAFNECCGFTGRLIIPNGITEIGSQAFEDCGFTGNLKIPDGVISIGDRAFCGCSGFTGGLVIPDGVTRIGEYSFYGCSGFTGGLVIPDGVTSISDHAFYGCSGFTGRLVIPDGVTSISYCAFDGCSGFAGDLTIPDSVTEIGSYAFYGCSGFTGDLTIPDGVTEIGSYAFFGCSGFTGGLVIPDGVTSISYCAFDGCSGFTGSLMIPDGVTSISHYAFNGCSGFTGGLVIPDDVTWIGEEAFKNCRGFTGNLIIGNSVTKICDSAFYGCSGFTGSLTIGNSVTEIGWGAFYNCNGFVGNLTIPDSVTKIGNRAFTNCTGFNGKLYLSSNLQEIEGNYYCERDDGAFRNCSGFTGSLTIPDNVIEIGECSFYGCSGFTGSLTIGNDVTKIGEYAFYNCKSFTGNLTIGNSVTEIGAYAFDRCSGFTGDLTIPNSVITIGMGAFCNCSSLNGSLTLGSNLQMIGGTDYGEGAFDGCTGLTGKLVIPDSVTTIEGYAFSDCKGFSGDIVIPDSVEKLGRLAFDGCSGFDGNLLIGAGLSAIEPRTFFGCSGLSGKLEIGENVKTIGYLAFSDCCNLSGDLIVPESVLKIDAGAFENCSKFASLQLSENLSEIGGVIYTYNGGRYDGAFQGCSGFQGTLRIPDKIETLPNAAFADCSGFSRLILPKKLKAIGSKDNRDYNTKGTFEGCIGFTGELVIPETVTVIETNAFKECSGFTGSLIIGNSVTEIGAHAFKDCSGFTGGLTIPNSVTEIGWAAFENCSGFAGSLTIGNSVTRIGAHAFKDCSGFTGSLTIPNSVTSIGGDVFYGCSGFTGSLVIPDSVTEIGGGAFEGCSGFTGSLVIPDNVTEILGETFKGCSGFTGGLTIGNSVTSIGGDVFYGCSGFTGSLVIPDSVTKIGGNAFYGCNGFSGTLTVGKGLESGIGYLPDSNDGFTEFIVHPENENYSSYDGIIYNKEKTEIVSAPKGKTGELKLPNSLQSIPSSCFSGCSGLTGSLTIPDSVTKIGNYAFSGCSGFTDNLTIPDSVTEIGNYAFRNCSGFGSVTMPESMTEIGSSAFDGCTNLKTVYYGGNKAQWNNISISSGNDPLKSANIRYDTYVANGDDSVPESGTAISLTKDRYTFTTGEQSSISAYMTSPNLSDNELRALDVNWESSDDSILTVKYTNDHPNKLMLLGYCEIIVTAIPHKAGTVTVTAKTADGAESKRTVTVMAPGNAIEMDKRTYVLEQGKSLPFFASVSNDNNSFCSWSSSNANVVSVTEDGGDIEVMHPIEPTSVFSDRIVLYANNPGTATITCRLDSGQSASKTITVKTAAELAHERAEEAFTANYYNTPTKGGAPSKKLEKAANDWDKAYHEYTKALAKEVQAHYSKGADKREHVIENNAKKMMAEDKTALSSKKNLNVSNSTLPSKWVPYVYQAYCTALYDNADQKISLSGIDPTEKNAYKIATSVAASIRVVDETYHYENGKLEINVKFTGFSGARAGQITCRDTRNARNSYLIPICSTMETCNAVMSDYIKEMTELEYNAVDNLYSAFAKDITGLSFSDLTENYLKEKITKKASNSLQNSGFGKVKESLLSIGRYGCTVYNAAKAGRKGDIQKAWAQVEKLNVGIDEESITNAKVKEKAKKLNSAAKNLLRIGEEYLAGTLTEESFWDKVKKGALAFISCPVDIEIYDESGSLIGYIGEDDEWCTDDEIAIEENGGSKAIFIPDGRNISFKAVGNDSGVLDLTIEHYENGEPAGRSNYYDIPLEAGKTVTAIMPETSNADTMQALKLNVDGKEKSPNEYIPVEQDACIEITATAEDAAGQVNGTGLYTRGDSVVLHATPNSDYRFTGWYSNGVWISSDSVYEFAAKEDIALTARFSKIECTLANDLIAISSEYQDICTAFAEETENQFVLHLKPLEGKTLPAVTAYLAIYNSDGKMIDMQPLSKVDTTDGIDFSGVVPKENCKLFVLDSRYHPVLVAYSNIR